MNEMMMEEEEQVDGLPKPDDKMDPRNRFKEYLEAQLERRRQMELPEYQGRMADAKEGLYRAKDNANLGALLMDSASRFGMAGGKQVESGMNPFAQSTSRNIDGYMADSEKMQANREAGDAQAAKLYQYLAQQRNQEENQKRQMFEAMTKRNALKNPKWDSLSGAKDPEGFPLERDQFGNTRRIPGAGPHRDKPNEVSWKPSDLVDETTGAPLMLSNTGETRPIKGAIPKKDIPKEPGTRLKDLSTSDKGRLDNISMATKALIDMEEALINQDQNTFSLVGDNDYTSANRLLSEAVGRMQSGGAISKDEEKRFLKMAPTALDSPQIQKRKLAQMRDEMRSRLQTLGFAPEDIPGLGDYKPSFANPSSGTAIAAPANNQKVTVSNGSETLLIDPDDEADAAKDGYKRVP